MEYGHHLFWCMMMMTMAAVVVAAAAGAVAVAAAATTTMTTILDVNFYLVGGSLEMLHFSSICLTKPIHGHCDMFISNKLVFCKDRNLWKIDTQNLIPNLGELCLMVLTFVNHYINLLIDGMGD